MVNQTSIQAYKELNDNTSDRQRLVLNAFRTLEIANNKMISEYLSLPINCITGRYNELKDLKFLTFSHKALCPYTSKMTEFFKLTGWGLENSEVIDNVKQSRLIYRDYLIESGWDTTIFKSCSKDINSKEWHNVEIVSSPSGELRSVCDCYDFNETKNKKQDCKHILDLKLKLRRNNEI